MDFNKRRFTIVFALVGIVLGYLYAELIGCNTGCTLKSSPGIMSLYGAFFGGVAGSFIDDYRNKRRSKEQTDSK